MGGSSISESIWKPPSKRHNHPFMFNGVENANFFIAMRYTCKLRIHQKAWPQVLDSFTKFFHYSTTFALEDCLLNFST